MVVEVPVRDADAPEAVCEYMRVYSSQEYVEVFPGDSQPPQSQNQPSPPPTSH